MPGPTQFPPRRWRWLLGLALLPVPIGSLAAAVPANPRVAASSARPPVVCEAAVRHPIDVRIEALDPVRPGAPVRLRVTSSSALGLSDSEARVTSAGGATVIGRSRASLGRMSPGRPAAAEFAVRVPERGERALVQFRVEGEGTAGRIGRGATFNLLPNGPTGPARVVESADGPRIAEYPARRMP